MGAPPPARVQVVVARDSLKVVTDLTFDAATGTLQWSVVAGGLAAENMFAVSLHMHAAGAVDGPSVAVLARPGQLTSAGRMVLAMPARLAMHQGQLYITVLTSTFPRGTLRAGVPVPSGPILRPTSPQTQDDKP